MSICSSKSTYAYFMVFPILSHGPFLMSKWWSTRPKKNAKFNSNPNPRDRPKACQWSRTCKFVHVSIPLPFVDQSPPWCSHLRRLNFRWTKKMTTARVMGRGASAVANGVPEKEWITGTNLLVLWKRMTSWQMFFCVAVWWFNDRLKLLIDSITGPWRSRRM